MIDLVEAVKQTYKFVHPMDKNTSGINNFSDILSEKQSLQNKISQQQSQQDIKHIETDISLDLYEQLEKMFIQ